MYIDFEKMPQNARIWVYQAGKNLENTQETQVLAQLKAFTDTWAAHQVPLQASVCVLHQRFVVLAVNQEQTPPSGCSIDASVAFLRKIEADFGLKLLERSEVAFLQNYEIQTVTLKEIKQKIAEGVLHSESNVFDNTVATLADFKEKWQQPARNTWLARYF